MRPDGPSFNRSLGVVVTGGTSGLGRAMAQEFLLAGDRVVICGRDRKRLESALCQLRDAVSGGKVYGTVCDVSDRMQVRSFAAFAASRLGVIDRWINNAGTAGGFRRPLWELDPSDIDETCRTNLSGTMMMCAEVVRIMNSQPVVGPGPGYHIFNMGFSLPGFRASPTSEPHRISKRAVALTTAELRRELRAGRIDSVGVHELSPGLVLTGLLLKDAGRDERRFFNAVAELPESVAAVLVPRIRRAKGIGGTIRFRSVPHMLARQFAALFGFGKSRFFDPDGRRMPRRDRP